jgi:hypothetical protein
VYHRFDLGEIIAWILHGLWQTILDLIPLVDPWPESFTPPPWWTTWNSGSDWSAHLDWQNRPDSHLIECWIRGSWRNLGVWVEEVGAWARDSAKDGVRSWIGWARDGWDRFDDWIDSIGIRVGRWLPYWSESVIDGLNKVWDWLPFEIRHNWLSWGEIFDALVERARQWVRDAYAWLISQGWAAWLWVVAIGFAIRDWWDDARSTLDEFRANPGAFILSRLGTLWDRLRWFSDNALDFYVNLWSTHARDLVDFLADPPGWMYDRLEAYLERLW